MKFSLFQNQVALITGSSQGIGRATTVLLHDSGCKVVINHPGLPQTTQDAEVLAQELNTIRPGSAEAVAADVSKEDQVIAMMQHLQKRHGGIDFLVNNAGIIRDKTVAKMTLEEWQIVQDVNITGVFLCAKYGAEIMREGGSIVSISSLSAQVGSFGQGNYASAKAGVIALTKTLSRELAKRGIRVNAIAPGLIKTSITKNIPEEYLLKMFEQIPLRRQGEPEEIAKAVVFFCSDLASYVTGQTLSVNGGWYAS